METENEIKRVVRDRYASAALTTKRCCGAAAGKGLAQSDLGLDMIGDAYKAVDGYVADADLGLGCGLPTQHAGIKPGDVVLDLGSGAGIDAFVASALTHSEGTGRRSSLARMASAVFVQTKGLGVLLCSRM